MRRLPRASRQPPPARRRAAAPLSRGFASSRSRSRRWSSAATWTRRASGSASSSRMPSAARGPHRLSVPARRRRCRRGRAGRVRQGVHPHHARIARPGRSRSGSPAFSSTGASICARRGAPARCVGRCRGHRRGRSRARPIRPPSRPSPRTALLSRERARARSPPPSIGSPAGSGRSSRCATTATARRAKSAQALGLERIDGARSSVPRRAQAARAARRPAVIARARHLHGRAAARLLHRPSATASRSIRRSREHLADCARCGARYAELAAFMDTLAHDGRRRGRRRLPAGAAARASSAQIAAAPRARRPSGPRHQLSRAAPLTRRIARARVATAPRWIGRRGRRGVVHRRASSARLRHERLAAQRSVPASRRADAACSRRRPAVTRAPPGTTSSRRCVPRPARDRRSTRPRTRELQAVRRADAARLGRRNRDTSVDCDDAVPPLIFRKGLDLKHAVAGMLAENYHSDLVERVKADDFTLSRPAG